MIDTTHAKIMREPAMTDLADGVEAAITWASTAGAGSETRHGSVQAPVFQGNLYSPLKRLELKPGADFTLPLRLKNASPIPWEAFADSGLALGNHWLSNEGTMVIWSDGRAPLPRRLEPGSRAYLTLDITAPHVPGDYLLEVDLVEEGICWFGDFAFSPLQIPVRVAADRPGPPPGSRQVTRPLLLPAIFAWADRVPLLTRAARRKR